MTSRRRAITLLTIAVTSIGLLSACAPQPEPEPTPTAVFASEEEAFTAAEGTFVAYNQATNDLRNGIDGEDPLEFLTGKALNGELAFRKDVKEQGLTLTGETKVVSFVKSNIDLDARPAEIAAVACLDVSGTRVISAGMQDVTSPDRENTVVFKVVIIATEAELQISETTIEGVSC